MGHRVRLSPLQYVKPFVLGQKNDANDVAAICAAMTRPEIPAVAVKTIAQQDQQALHRIRSTRVAQRTALVNQTRGLLAEGFTPVFTGNCRRHMIHARRNALRLRPAGSPLGGLRPTGVLAYAMRVHQLPAEPAA